MSSEFNIAGFHPGIQLNTHTLTTGAIPTGRASRWGVGPSCPVEAEVGWSASSRLPDPPPELQGFTLPLPAPPRPGPGSLLGLTGFGGVSPSSVLADFCGMSLSPSHSSCWLNSSGWQLVLKHSSTE
uniref:Uncharacterized protein n=1 Tax=Leersia perrieri TaxID=77586 RepID=A0A0D9XJY7_9ORYZ